MTWLEWVGVAFLAIHAPIGAVLVALWMISKVLDFTPLGPAVLAAYRQHLERKARERRGSFDA